MTIRRYPIPTRKAPPRREIPPPVRRRALRRNPAGLLGLIILTLIVAATLSASALAPYDPLDMTPSQQLLPPSLAHPLGTDLFGRDVLSRVLYGARISLLVGGLAALIAALPGILLGLVSGYYGGRIDSATMRVMDTLLAFPGLILALGIVAVLRPGLSNVTLAVGLAGIPAYTRVVRSSVLTVKRSLYVRAARAVGCRDSRILFRHILPNVLAPVIVLSTLNVGRSILHASALSFLGLGVQPPTPEWGAMINEGREILRLAPWVSLTPAAMILLTVLGINLLGDGLRDALDPRLRA